MQRKLIFYGISDDLFECDDSTDKDSEEIGSYNSVAAYKITDGNVGMYVVGHYSPVSTGCRSVGILPLDEASEIPDWDMKFKLGGRGYTAPN